MLLVVLDVLLELLLRLLLRLMMILEDEQFVFYFYEIIMFVVQHKMKIMRGYVGEQNCKNPVWSLCFS